MVNDGRAAFRWGSIKYGNIHMVGNSLSVPSKNKDITKTLICLSYMYNLWQSMFILCLPQPRESSTGEKKHSNFIVQTNTDYLS